MKVKLLKTFGINQKGETIEANKTLYNHLLKGGFIAEAKQKEVKQTIKEANE